MQKYADIAMQNGTATEAAGLPSGGFCLARATPPSIAKKAAELKISALPRIPRGVARWQILSRAEAQRRGGLFSRGAAATGR